MLTIEQHLENLVRHIDLVRNAGLLLGRRLINQGQKELGRILIGNVYVHDASKFSGIEWEYLHAGKDTPKDKLDLAIKQHVSTNSHHPEYWGGFENIPEVFLAELACDWYARAMEFGTGLREWVNSTAVDKYKIKTDSPQYKKLQEFINLLLEDNFVR